MKAPAVPLEIPEQIGPVRLQGIARLVLVHAPHDFAPLIERAGGSFDKGRRAWWVERRRVGPLIRALEKCADPLFRNAGGRAGNPQRLVSRA